ncbi:MAG: endolytic transglycosylase MltG [Neisseria sp.]|nr:endolytic transglycosylase MltG [Neisseria sp.]
MKKPTTVLLLVSAAAAAALAASIFAPKQHSGEYRLKITKGQGMSAVSRKLAADGIIHNRAALLAAAHLAGTGQIRAGTYRLPQRLSAWELAKRLQGRPDTVTVRIIEGVRFAQMRELINRNQDLDHETATWGNEKLLQAIDPQNTHADPEGLFAPDSYEIELGGSDLQVYRLAYAHMQKNLKRAWEGRKPGLPYQTPYEMLIMASIIEKETGLPSDRRDISAVFANRLNIGMRLQTDPTVIYGMGDKYSGKIRKADLQEDTPYNTYTRGGLPPTPISLPGRAALEAAAHPSDAKYLYFVSRMDGSGASVFSHTLEEHNAAVRRYILN